MQNPPFQPSDAPLGAAGSPGEPLRDASGDGAAPLSIERHRKQFPALTEKVYLNYGGQGPLPWTAIDAMQQATEYLQQIGPFSEAANLWIMEETRELRAAIAGELGVAAETIALTENVSVGCNIALWGLDWQPGDHLLLSDCEHPSVLGAVQELQRRFHIQVSTCPLMATLNGGDPVAVIARALQPKTRLVALSHILWNTGQVLPLREIVAVCHDYRGDRGPVRVLVDAAQSVGVLPLNLADLGVDFYAFTGHKWWCGPAGVGGLYIHPEALEGLHPTFIGWRGITATPQGDPIGWKTGSWRFEVATSDYSLYSGLGAAIVTHQQWGLPEDVYTRLKSLSGWLWEKLQTLPTVSCLKQEPPEAGLVSFQITGYDQASYGQVHQKLVRFLEYQGIMVRTIRHPDCVRACVHYLTTEADLDRLVTTIAAFQLE
ncbi:MAG: aminotransferase class V-fold PLP-dependent enzyme [Leptolyngbyaceae cyanobacterium bins.59]|nr:aminotransferase class V-fold PLP-dependent enzyme [Leptolyngbyaceae cyanobacterium bins.59]